MILFIMIKRVFLYVTDKQHSQLVPSVHLLANYNNLRKYEVALWFNVGRFNLLKKEYNSVSLMR